MACYLYSVLKLAAYKYVGWRSKTTNVTDRIGTMRYYLFCDTSWSRSGALINCLFHFVVIFSTAVPNRRYLGSKTMDISVGCIGLFISLLWSLSGISFLDNFLSLVWRCLNWLQYNDFAERGQIIWESVVHWGSYGWNRGIPSKI